MEVVAAVNFLLDLINAIVNACIIYNIMVSPLCANESQYVEYAEEDYTDCNIKKMKNHYTLIIYSASQKKMLLIILRLNLILLWKAEGHIP